jgi:hypothetical protein
MDDKLIEEMARAIGLLRHGITTPGSLDRELAQACAFILKNRIEGLEDALKPFAVLEVPSNPEGNAGFYSLRFGDLRKARAALSPVGVTHDL